MYNRSYKRCYSIETLSHILVITYAGLVSKSITHDTVVEEVHIFYMPFTEENISIRSQLTPP